MLKFISAAGYLLMAGALLSLIAIHSLFSPQPIVIAVQAGAAILMIWARMTFGRRSFHATADPTGGGLVTSGPYKYIRHPIYTAAAVFGWAGVLSHLSAVTVAAGVILLAGALMRMILEERLLVRRYPEYGDYAARTKRMIPGLF